LTPTAGLPPLMMVQRRMISPLEFPPHPARRLTSTSRNSGSRTAAIATAIAVALSMVSPHVAAQPKPQVPLVLVRDGQVTCIWGMTGLGRPPDWRAVRDEGGEAGWALVETSNDPTDLRFPLCVVPDVMPLNIEVSLRLRIVGGTRQQAGGLMFRSQGATHYYVARASALDNTVRLYRMNEGRRAQIAMKETKVSADDWHTIRVRAIEEKIEVFFDDVSLFTATERNTLPPGNVGVWTQSDSVVHFGRLTVGPP
jgi:hypothetical protein